MKDCKDIKKWVKPEVEELGNAKDIVANINTFGGGDSQFDLLIPS
tara:strand:- start:546 stop:680 length:135 start_codon:yes stop_codon:yes gene_type:complete